MATEDSAGAGAAPEVTVSTSPAAGAAAALAAAAVAPGSLDRTQIASRLAVVVGRINRRIRPAADGLSHGLLSALATIVRKGPLRPSDVARLEMVAAPSATRAIADLETRGLVVRQPDPADGRSFFIESTDAGVEAVLRARSQRAVLVAELLAGVSADELAKLAAALDALEAAAAAPAAPAAG